VGYDYHVVFGVLATIIGIAAYVPYFRDIYRGTTKPHPFTWLLFGLLNGIVFFGQSVSQAGPGAWITGLTSIASFTLAIVGLRTGKKYIAVIDYVCLAGALLGVVLWVITKEPLAAIVVVTITDAVAFVPTVRKAYLQPDTETASTYLLGTVKYVLGIIALQSITLTTALFPTSISILNTLFICMVLIRRRQLKKP
jgi:hypothetical protein